jgi:UPF0755 protein
VARRNRGSLTGAALFLAALVALLVGISGYDAWQRPGPLPHAQTVIIPKGAGVAEIAALLKHHRVIASPFLFEIAARLEKRGTTLRAGEYAFPPHVTLRNVILALRSGRTVVRKLTVPEGLTSRQVLALVMAAPALEGNVTVIPAEGTLLPETYYYSFGDGREALIRRMARAMSETLRELWEMRAPDLPLRSPEEAVILASIVEKETARADERPRIAAVFLNRLRLGMRLQADPTVTYGTDGTDRDGQGAAPPATGGDLQIPSPYNTYLIDGLPPAPIANPGRAALVAVLQPAVTDDLYFVADGTGGHAFARSLDEHNRNVRRWRRLQRASPP